MELRFGALRPYRQLRLDVKWRQLCRQTQRSPTSSKVDARSSALEALLSPGQNSDNESEVAHRRSNTPDPLLSLAHVAAGLYKTPPVPAVAEGKSHLPASNSTGCLPLATSSNGPMPSETISDQRTDLRGTSRSFALRHNTFSVDPPSRDAAAGEYSRESVLVAQDIVRSHAEGTRRHRDHPSGEGARLQHDLPAADERKRSRSHPRSPLMPSESLGDTVRRSRPTWTSDERAHLDKLVNIYGRNWARIAGLMQQHFDGTRDYTAQSVMMQFRRVNGLMKGRGVRCVDAERRRQLAEQAASLSPTSMDTGSNQESDGEPQPQEAKRPRLSLPASPRGRRSKQDFSNGGGAGARWSAEPCRKISSESGGDDESGPISTGLLERLPRLSSHKCAIQ